MLAAFNHINLLIDVGETSLTVQQFGDVGHIVTSSEVAIFPLSFFRFFFMVNIKCGTKSIEIVDVVPEQRLNHSFVC